MKNKTVRAASRHILMAEFVLGVFLVAWGAGKGADAKGLAMIAKGSGWILPCVIGAVQAVAAAIEWFSPSRTTLHLFPEPQPEGWWAKMLWHVREKNRRRKPWPNSRLQRCVGVRGFVAGLAAVMWTYDLKNFFLDPVVLSAVVLILVAPVCVGINLYSVYMNRKVWVALDPSVSTSGLHFDH